MNHTRITRQRADDRTGSAGAAIRGAITALLLVAALAPSLAHADEQPDAPPPPWSVAGLYTAASADGGIGPPMAFAAAGVDRVSIKFLNIGPWWEVMPRVHFPIDENHALSLGAGLQQLDGTLYPRIELGARGKFGSRGFYSAALEIDATHTPLPDTVGWGGLFKSGVTVPAGDGTLEAFVRYEGGGIGGGPAVALRHPVGATRVRGFVGSTLLRGDPTTKSLADLTLHPLSGVGGVSVRF